MNSDNYDLDLSARANLIKRNQAHMVEVSKLERLVDEAHLNNGNYFHFIETFKKLFPREYKSVVKLFNK